MPTITVINKENKTTVSCQEGDEFLQIEEKTTLPIRFGCRRGECGVCAIKIIEGEEFLGKQGSKEKQTLYKKDLDSSYRLACQCLANGKITLKPLLEPLNKN